MLGAALLVPTLLGSLIFSGCGEKEAEKPPVQYTATIVTEGGMPLSDVGFSVYKDEGGSELVWAGETDRSGMLSFAAPEKEYYCMKLNDLSDSYAAEESYKLSTGDNRVVLKAVILDGEMPTGARYERGSIIRDFTFTDTDGKEYKISQLLQEKKAVVLNFWFMNCDPCKSEFPAIQEAYSKYSDKIELLAMNPLDSTNESIAQFASERELTFPMATCSNRFVSDFGLMSYPTTVVIDRYGMICMIHTGAVTEPETLEKIFEYFTADDYTQRIIRNISEIEE